MDHLIKFRKVKTMKFFNKKSNQIPKEFRDIDKPTKLKRKHSRFNVIANIKDFKIEQMQKLEIAKAEFIAEKKDEKVRRQKEIDFINGVGKLITWLLIIAVIYFIFIR